MPANGPFTLNSTPQVLYDRATDQGDVAAAEVANTGDTNDAEIFVEPLHGVAATGVYAAIPQGQSKEFVCRKGITRILGKSASGTTIRLTATGG